MQIGIPSIYEFCEKNKSMTVDGPVRVLKADPAARENVRLANIRPHIRMKDLSTISEQATNLI